VNANAGAEEEPPRTARAGAGGAAGPSVGASGASEAPSGRRLDSGRWAAGSAAALLIVLGFLPVAQWAGGSLDGLYAGLVREWVSGSAIAVGLGAVLAICSRDVPALWPAQRLTRMATRIDGWAARRPRHCDAAIAGGATALALLLAVWLFNARPILIDEIAQLRQAQIFAGGHLWLTAPRFPAFVSSLLMVNAGGRLYSQFPPGGPAMLALGQLLGAPWIVDPVAAGVSILAFAALVRRAEARPVVRAGAVVLFACAPFALFMSASHMNHVTALMWLLVGAAAVAAALADDTPHPLLAAASGFAFGAAATIRPADALAFAIPAAVWYLARVWRDPTRWGDIVAAGLGLALPIGAMMAVDAATTGAPLRLGYAVLWGSGHTLGFHRAPWGEAHTPLRGLVHVNTYLLQLQRYLFETPIPSLLPAVIALASARRLTAVDRYLLASAGLLLAVYFAYFHEGFYLGPRFVFPLVPVLALWTARAPAALRGRLAERPLLYRGAVYTLAVSAGVAIVVGIPVRALAHARTGASERWATPQVASAAGVHGALVFVREPWDAQLVARMWALGVSHPDAEVLYAHVDACRLELALTALEQDASDGGTASGTASGTATRPGATVGAPTATRAAGAATGVLRALLRDSARVHRQALASGVTVHMQDGYEPAPVCLARVREMLVGTAPLAPFLLLDDGNIYARDLHERDTLLVAAYPGRPVYLLRTDGPGAEALPRFFPYRPPASAPALSP